ncbi:12615_t:CDS:1, partial [Rhizophagus irregularis]
QNVGGLAITQVTSGYFTFNKARLYRNHLANCENFKSLYSKEEITEILFHSVPEDSKKKSKNCNK